MMNRHEYRHHHVDSICPWGIYSLQVIDAQISYAHCLGLRSRDQRHPDQRKIQGQRALRIKTFNDLGRFAPSILNVFIKRSKNAVGIIPHLRMQSNHPLLNQLK